MPEMEWGTFDFWNVYIHAPNKPVRFLSTVMLRPPLVFPDPHLGDVDKAHNLTQEEIGRLNCNIDTILTLRNTPQTSGNINFYVITTSRSRNLQDFWFAFLDSSVRKPVGNTNDIKTMIRVEHVQRATPCRLLQGAPSERLVCFAIWIYLCINLVNDPQSPCKSPKEEKKQNAKSIHSIFGSLGRSLNGRANKCWTSANSTQLLYTSMYHGACMNTP